MSTGTNYCGVSMPIPESYQKAIQANSSLLEQLFGLGSTVTLTTSITAVTSEEPEVFKTLLHFLDVFIEIFDYSAKQQKNGSLVNPVIKGDSPVLQQCITKFREIWRQGFRGFQYLSEKKLERIGKRAELETLIKLTFQGKNNEIEANLREIISLEKSWIRKINDHKRNKDLDVIQIETVDKFKAAVVMEFPYLFDEDGNGNNFRFCEDAFFEWKLGIIIANCRNGFIAEIPFEGEEKEDILRFTLDSLNAKLDEMINDLKSRNSSKKIVICEYMNSLVDKCVENYKINIKTAIFGENGENTQVQIETETILKLHKRCLEESTPKFVMAENGIEIGTNEYQIKCLNMFNNKTYEIFRNLVENVNENCEINMTTCHQETQDEIQSCLQKVTEILGRYQGMISYSNVLRSKFEGGMGSIFGQVKEVNNLNKELLLTATKPVEIQTSEEIHYKNLMETCKKNYSDKLLSSLQESLKYPNSVDSNLLETCHQIAKFQAITQIRKAKQPSLLSPYLSHQLISKFDQFVDHFIIKTKADVKAFIEHISGVLGTSTPFKAVPRFDGLHQCITVMKEYQDKSFEELHLEDKLKKCLPSQKITKLLEQSVSDFEINEDFKKSLNLKTFKKDFNFTKSTFNFPEMSSVSSQGWFSGNQIQSPTSSSLPIALQKQRKVNKGIRRFND